MAPTTDPSVPRESLIHFGPMTRSVADAALMQNVTAGPHPDDACSLRPKLEIPSVTTSAGPNTLKVSESQPIRRP